MVGKRVGRGSEVCVFVGVFVGVSVGLWGCDYVWVSVEEGVCVRVSQPKHYDCLEPDNPLLGRTVLCLQYVSQHPCPLLTRSWYHPPPL